MNPIQNTACLIAAYETAAGLPDRYGLPYCRL